MKPILDIKDFTVEVDGMEILHGLNLHIQGGEVHAIMGPNGTGKSTLASALMGHPRYTVSRGEVTLNGRDLLALSVDERARAGLFLAMQYPAEVSGVTNSDFLRSAVNARRQEPLGVLPFLRELNEAVSELEMRETLPDRYLNEGFSGGEKKRNEILQMKLLQPRIALLDEIDSGLDIDALRIVGQNITAMIKERGDQMGLLMITHYQRLLDYIEPQFVHVLMNGRIVHTGDASLAKRLEAEGYDWLRRELNLSVEDDTDVAETVGDIDGDLDALFM
ncbi:MAG TPA: Fe-S cluster assembly ATPase SufC [Clostridiaceae bacterium]|nr:Fe-S cluster assembly ATPase SufC [Clostridiaceae bacterium]